MLQFSYQENDYNPEHDPCVPVEADFLYLWRPDCRLRAVRTQCQVQLAGK